MPKIIHSKVPVLVQSMKDENSNEFDFVREIGHVAKINRSAKKTPVYQRQTKLFFGKDCYDEISELLWKLHERLQPNMQDCRIVETDDYTSLLKSTHFKYGKHSYVFEYSFEYSVDKNERKYGFYLRDKENPYELVNGILFMDQLDKKWMTGGWSEDSHFNFDVFTMLAKFLRRLRESNGLLEF